MQTRRSFTRQALGSLVTFSLVKTLCEHDLFADTAKPITAQWLHDVNTLCADLRDQDLGPVEWQKKMEELSTKIELDELLKLIDFDRLTNHLEVVDRGASSLRFKFSEIEGSGEKIVFGKQVFALREGRSVVPHGHNNMNTAFIILKGQFHGRHYDRLADEPGHMILRPSIDETFGPGSCSTVSDLKDNVHWFKALSEPAFIFNLHVLGVDPNNKKRLGRVYVDPNGERLADGTIRAPLIDYKVANERYG